MPEHTKDKQNNTDADEVKREDIEFLTIGNTTYEIASVYATGSVTLLDKVKSSLERHAQQAVRDMMRTNH